MNEQQTKGTVMVPMSSGAQSERPPRKMRPRSFFSRSIAAPRATSSSPMSICCITIVQPAASISRSMALIMSAKKGFDTPRTTRPTASEFTRTRSRALLFGT